MLVFFVHVDIMYDLFFKVMVSFFYGSFNGFYHLKVVIVRDIKNAALV